MYVSCEFVAWSIVDGGFVLYVGILETLDGIFGGFVTGCVYVAYM